MVRRGILFALVLGALALLTISFRSPTSGALHDAQGYGASALRPFEVAAQRVARPFRDAYGYFDGLAHARSENKKLRREVRQWRAQATQFQAQAGRAQDLERLLRVEGGSRYPSDFRFVSAWISPSSTIWTIFSSIVLPIPGRSFAVPSSAICATPPGVSRIRVAARR